MRYSYVNLSKDRRTRNDLRIICDVQCKKVHIKKVEERKSKVEELKTPNPKSISNQSVTEPISVGEKRKR
jgi:hypothetical protein